VNGYPVNRTCARARRFRVGVIRLAVARATVPRKKCRRETVEARLGVAVETYSGCIMTSRAGTVHH
jgi:hypothetical protein